MSACLAFLHKLRKLHCVLTDCKLTHDSRCETRVKLKHYKILLCVHNSVIWLVNTAGGSEPPFLDQQLKP